MPVFEIEYTQAVGRNPAGGTIQVPPADALCILGPRIPVRVVTPPSIAAALRKKGSAVPDAVEGHALFDTGSAISLVDYDVVFSHFGLQESGAVLLKGIGAEEAKSHPCFPVTVEFLQGMLPSITFPRMPGVPIKGEKPPHDNLVILGRDIMKRMVFTYNGLVGRMEVAY